MVRPHHHCPDHVLEKRYKHFQFREQQYISKLLCQTKASSATRRCSGQPGELLPVHLSGHCFCAELGHIAVEIEQCRQQGQEAFPSAAALVAAIALASG